MENTYRKPGFYWVKFKREWIIARYHGEYWSVSGYKLEFIDLEFEEIDPKPVQR